MSESNPVGPSRDQRVRSRSPLLLDRSRSSLLVIDVQEKLLPLIRHSAEIAWNIRRLMDGAKILEIPVVATEQYPVGLGSTSSELRERLGPIPDKRMFSCRECGHLFDQWDEAAVEQIVVVGIEAHVCVQQTSLDLIAMGFDVYVVVDAVGSRFELDEQVGLRRIEQSGGTLTTTESVLFEWCETSGIPEFKKISDLVRERVPAR